MWGGGGVRGSSAGNIFRFKVAKPLKFNSKHFGNPRNTGGTKEFIMANSVIKARLDEFSISIALHLHWLGKG